MTEFVLKDRRLRLYPDGKITSRAVIGGKETKKDTWRVISFKNVNGYFKCEITVDGISRSFAKHRLIYLAHNPEWDIFDNSKDNYIDHINRNPSDNSIENLRVVTQQHNQFNRDGRGYCWCKSRNKWQSSITLNGKVIGLGRFDKEEDARAAYLKAKARLHIMPP